jgi:hypothetical protein
MGLLSGNYVEFVSPLILQVVVPVLFLVVCLVFIV